MRARQAMKLHNRDEVEVRMDGKWSRGYVLGEPCPSGLEGKRKSTLPKGARVIVPVQSEQHGFISVDHTDLR